ncbi:MAG: hypothetical protein PVI52_02070, partial [Chromatiales bacterium]
MAGKLAPAKQGKPGGCSSVADGLLRGGGSFAAGDSKAMKAMMIGIIPPVLMMPVSADSNAAHCCHSSNQLNSGNILIAGTASPNP